MEASNNTLVDILSEAMYSTVETNNRAADEFFQKLEEIGITSGSDGEPDELATVECVVKGKDDKEYTLKIPKLILMPMPLLHIKEATFDVEGEWEINEEELKNTINNVAESLSLSEAELSVIKQDKPKHLSAARKSFRNVITIKNPNDSTRLSAVKQLSKLSTASIRRLIIEEKIPTVSKRELLNEIRTPIRLANIDSTSSTMTNTTSESQSSNKQNIKIRVAVRMEQSDMPAGLSNLIQTVSNCIEVKAPVTENESNEIEE
ncbi:MAG: DUF2589 domain-containing protein [Paludibacteraceae bacterium]|nr:DUF2589 domain-containing protein [Paludibacteraceae bacterium]